MMGCSVVVFCKNGIIENISLGTADHTRNIDMSVDSKYRIASVSKTITAIAAMQLAEQNLLDLDEDISSILGYTVQNPNNPNVAITTRMLLSHTSTIIDGSTYNSFLGATTNNYPIPNLSEILTLTGSYYSAGQFNNTIPGNYFNYSNINYVILGTIIEKISKQRFDIYCKLNILDPLELEASFNVSDFGDINQIAVLYRKPSGVWTAQADNFQGDPPEFIDISNYIPGTNGGRFGPQGGLRCSAQDLATIFLCLFNEGTFNNITILSQESVVSMLNNEWSFSGNNGNNYFGLFRSWGLGIHRITSTAGNDIALPGSTSMFGHTGEAYGLVSDAYFDTIRKVGFIFLTNGVGLGYQSNNNSVFYTVEQQVFSAIENHGNISSCASANLFNENSKSFEIFPNPCQNQFEISNFQLSESDNIRISSVDGSQTFILIPKQGQTSIDISFLNNGIYFVSINGSVTKIVKH